LRDALVIWLDENTVVHGEIFPSRMIPRRFNISPTASLMSIGAQNFIGDDNISTIIR